MGANRGNNMPERTSNCGMTFDSSDSTSIGLGFPRLCSSSHWSIIPSEIEPKQSRHASNGRHLKCNQHLSHLVACCLYHPALPESRAVCDSDTTRFVA